jgi:hypothetical protein
VVLATDGGTCSWANTGNTSSEATKKTAQHTNRIRHSKRTVLYEVYKRRCKLKERKESMKSALQEKMKE